MNGGWCVGMVDTVAYRLVVLTVHVLSCCVVLWVVEWRCVWFVVCLFSFSCLPLLPVFLVSSLLFVFGVVRAQLCEHARYPRTPLCFLVVSSFLFFRTPPFFCWNGGVCSPCVGVPGWHDGDW